MLGTAVRKSNLILQMFSPLNEWWSLVLMFSTERVKLILSLCRSCLIPTHLCVVPVLIMVRDSQHLSEADFFLTAFTTSKERWIRRFRFEYHPPQQPGTWLVRKKDCSVVSQFTRWIEGNVESAKQGVFSHHICFGYKSVHGPVLHFRGVHGDWPSSGSSVVLMKRCGRCKKANHCSDECQAAHWKAAQGVPRSSDKMSVFMMKFAVFRSLELNSCWSARKSARIGTLLAESPYLRVCVPFHIVFLSYLLLVLLRSQRFPKLHGLQEFY